MNPPDLPDSQIKSIACWQRMLLSATALVLISVVAVGVHGESRDAMFYAIGAAIFLFMLLASVASIVLAFKLKDTAFGVFVIILNLVPCANLVAILIVNSMATSRLKKAGYRVGLGGASASK